MFVAKPKPVNMFSNTENRHNELTVLIYTLEPLDKFMIFQECIEFIWVAQNYRICFQIQTKCVENERVEEISFFVFKVRIF